MSITPITALQYGVDTALMDVLVQYHKTIGIFPSRLLGFNATSYTDALAHIRHQERGHIRAGATGGRSVRGSPLGEPVLLLGMFDSQTAREDRG